MASMKSSDDNKVHTYKYAETYLIFKKPNDLMYIPRFQLQGAGVTVNQQLVSECKTEGPHSKPDRQSIPPCRARSNLGGKPHLFSFRISCKYVKNK